jgi:predicted phosphodiesterase
MMPNQPDSASDPSIVQSDATLDRRRFLSHVAWAGTAMVFTASGGVLSACGSSKKAPASAGGATSTTAGSAATSSSAATSASTVAATTTTTLATSDLTFVQISDTHTGFTGPANADVDATYAAAVTQINALAHPPAFVIHTGDLTHTSTPEQFDKAKQLLSTIKAPKVFTVPGEHDSTDDAGQKYRSTFGAGSKGNGWYSFDVSGIHFLALVNTVGLTKLGLLGPDQLAFIKDDLAAVSSETPLVLFSHIPLFAMYPDWGWATDDALQALEMTKRFGSVTAINGHVHQTMTKTEGNVTFYAGRSTAYPLPKPGEGPAPKPVALPADQLRGALGVRSINYLAAGKHLDVLDQTLT